LKRGHKRLLDGKSLSIIIKSWLWRIPFLYYEIQDAGTNEGGDSACLPISPLH
jgi:hypothetical protein